MSRLNKIWQNIRSWILTHDFAFNLALRFLQLMIVIAFIILLTVIISDLTFK